jgi:predicted MFS family arabinose efflux permease
MSGESSSAGRVSRYKWAVVAMLWFVCFFNYADRQAVYSVKTPIAEEFQLTQSQWGLVGSSFMWVYAVASPFAGFVGDRFRRKTLILGGLFFWSIVCAATALSTRYWHLLLFRALEGFGEAFYFPASMALISSYHGPDTRSRAMSIHQSGVYLGTIAGGALGGWMGDRYDWRSSFWLLGALGVLLGFCLLVLLREPAPDAPGTEENRDAPPSFAEWWRDFRSAIDGFLSNRTAFRLMCVFICANFVAAIFLTWLPSFLHDKFQMSLTLGGITASVYPQLASVLGVVTGGLLADRLATRHRAGRMITQALGLFCGVPFLFLSGWTLSVTVLVATLIGFGCCKGIYDSNIWASLHDWVEPRRRAASVGFMNAVAWLGGGVATAIVGVVAERYGLSVCLSATSLVYLAAALLLVLGTAKKTRVRF